MCILYKHQLYACYSSQICINMHKTRYCYNILPNLSYLKKKYETTKCPWIWQKNSNCYGHKEEKTRRWFFLAIEVIYCRSQRKFSPALVDWEITSIMVDKDSTLILATAVLCFMSSWPHTMHCSFRVQE